MKARIFAIVLLGVGGLESASAQDKPNRQQEEKAVAEKATLARTQAQIAEIIKKHDALILEGQLEAASTYALKANELDPINIAGKSFFLLPIRHTERRAQECMLKTYQVADLVLPVQDDPPEGADRPTKEKMAETLINTIMCTLAQDSWTAVGGPGSIQYFPLGMALVVNQTEYVHKQIRTLLTDLRRQQDVQIAMELRILKLPDVALERVIRDFQVKDPGQGQRGVKFLDDKQVKQILEGVQGDRKTEIMQAPKITTFNGQQARIEVTDQQYFLVNVKVVELDGRKVFVPENKVFKTGFQFQMRSVAAEDCKSVHVNLAARLDQIDPNIPLVPLQLPGDKGKDQQVVLQQPRLSTVAVDKVLRVPAGQTALVHFGPVTEETRTDFGPPILSKVPCLGRLVRNADSRRETLNMVILATPRIIINVEEEQVFSGPAVPVPRP